MQSLASRLTWELDRSSGLSTVYVDGQFLATGPDIPLRLALYGRGGLADTLTDPQKGTQ